MSHRFRPSLLALTLTGFGLAQSPAPGVSVYLDLGPSLAQPLLARVSGTAASTTLDLSRLEGTLTRVGPGEAQGFPVVLSGPAGPVTVPGRPANATNTTPGPKVPLGLQTDAPAGVYTLKTPLPTGQSSELTIGLNPSIHAPDPLQPGTRFLSRGGGPYTLNGRTLAYAELAGKLLTLKTVGTGGASFEVEGLNGLVRWSGIPTGNFPKLVPVADDPALVQAQRQYANGVWMYGGLRAECSPVPQSTLTFSAPLRQKLRVKRLLRLAQPGWAGAARYLGLDNGGADLISLSPIVVQLERPAGARAEGGSAQGLGGQGLVRLLDGATTSPDCATLSLTLADSWSLSRTFSLVPPSARVPAKAPVSVKGLDQWQYAWLFGFPSATFGTRDELLGLDRWQYINIPFPATVSFDQQGKVQKLDVPRLP